MVEISAKLGFPRLSSSPANLNTRSGFRRARIDDLMTRVYTGWEWVVLDSSKRVQWG